MSNYIIMESLNKKDKRTLSKYTLTPAGELTTSSGRKVVPKIRSSEVLKLNHDHLLAGYIGIAKTYARVKRQYKWPKMRDDVTRYVNGCLKCVKRKSLKALKAPLVPIAAAPTVWTKIAVDISGPYAETDSGLKYIMVVSDYTTRHVVTMALKDQTADTVARHLVLELFLIHGAHHTILSDRGSVFMSHLVAEICKVFKIHQAQF